MFAEYLKAIGGTWKNLVWEALSVIGLLVALRLFTEPSVWVYWAILSGAALAAPYWAYRNMARERDKLKAGQPLRAQLQRLVEECDKYRGRGVHPYDAAAIADGVLRLCSRFPDERCLDDLRAIKFPSENVHTTPDVFVTRTQHHLGRILVELEKPPPPQGPSDEERLEAAKALLREASADFYRDVVNPHCTYEKGKTYIGWAYRLMLALFADKFHADEFLIRNHDYKDKRLRENPAEACAYLAKALAEYPDWIQLPSGDPTRRHFLRDDFVPKPGRSWKDY